MIASSIFRFSFCSNYQFAGVNFVPLSSFHLLSCWVGLMIVSPAPLALAVWNHVAPPRPPFHTLKPYALSSLICSPLLLKMDSLTQPSPIRSWVFSVVSCLRILNVLFDSGSQLFSYPVSTSLDILFTCFPGRCVSRVVCSSSVFSSSSSCVGLR